MNAGEIHCPRCGAKLIDMEAFCPACGAETAVSTNHRGPDNRRYQNQTLPVVSGKSSREIDKYSAHPADLFQRKLSLIGNLFGWRLLDGTVIAVEQPYQVKGGFPWVKAAANATLCLMLIPIIMAICVMRIASSFASRFSYRSGPGIGAGIMNQLFGYFLFSRVFGPRNMIMVRDIRVRGKDGFEYLVRVRGELISGNLNVGDDITVEGPNTGGTVIMKNGWNERTRSRLIVRER